MLILYILLALIALILCLLAVACIRTLLMPTKKASYKPSPDPKREQEYAQKLSRMVQMETISYADHCDVEKFRKFHALLQELFPRVFAQLEKIDLDGNLLLKWKGKSSENPILLMSHMDVVEASGTWSHAPFSGDIADGKVWGRGAGDTKCSVMAFYQAVEELLEQGYEPACDIYLGSSCTEEVGGDGAPKIVQWFKDHGVHLAMLSDEGGGIIEEPIGGVKGCYAMIGVFEKGVGNLRFVARSQGGHASAPKKNTPLARIGKFIAHVEKKYPFKSQFSPEVLEMFERLAPYAGFGMRLIFGNLWLFKPLLLKLMPLISAQGAAMLRTTIAFTMAKGSDGMNVIPQEASVIANLRFIPHQGAKESHQIISALAAKYGLETEIIMLGEPSRAVDIHAPAFKLTEEAIAACFPGVGCSPYVVTGATDARFYSDVCDNCIRFSPVIFGPEQMKGMHGIDETIETNCLPGAVDYYTYLIRAQERQPLKQ